MIGGGKQCQRGPGGGGDVLGVAFAPAGAGGGAPAPIGILLGDQPGASESKTLRDF